MDPYSHRKLSMFSTLWLCLLATACGGGGTNEGSAQRSEAATSVPASVSVVPEVGQTLVSQDTTTIAATAAASPGDVVVGQPAVDGSGASDGAMLAQPTAATTASESPTQVAPSAGETAIPATSGTGAPVATTTSTSSISPATSSGSGNGSATTTVMVTRLESISKPQESPPPLSSLVPFVATPPYVIQMKDGPRRIQLGMYGTTDDVVRGFDFVSPFINPQTNRTNALTLQTPVQTLTGMKFVNVSDTSTPRAANWIPGDRIAYQPGELTIGYHPMDPVSSEKCRVMINSWQIPTRTTLTWDLSFKLGGSTPEEAWPKTKPTTSPTLLWQIKADPGYPSMGFFVDTSSSDQSKIQLTFFQRLQNQSFNDFRWVVPDIDGSQPINVIVQASLDDRDDADNMGTLKVWVNGQLIASRQGRNLIQGLSEPNRWAFGVYLTSEAVPINQSRITVWRRARMLVDPAS